MALSVGQYNAAKAFTIGTGAAAVAASTVANAAPTSVYLAVTAAGLLSAAADPMATWLRHGEDTKKLGWGKLAGRGWHIPIVATGLALTFGRAQPVEPAVEWVKKLSTMPGEVPGMANDVFARLFVGIEPMAVVVGVAKAVESGWREGVKSFGSETLANATGSALATLVGLPLYEGTLAWLFGKMGVKLTGVARGIADLGHYIVGYWTVLRAEGWADSRKNAASEL